MRPWLLGILLAGTSLAQAPCVPVTTNVCGSAVSDSHAVLLSALAKGGTINITCPTRIVIGQDYTRPVFIPDNVTINFSAGGELIVDNSLVPAFVMSGTRNVTWNNANILYVGSGPGVANNPTPVHNFQYQTLKPYNQAHLGNTYTGPSAPMDGGGIVNMSPIFLLQGAASNIVWHNLSISVPAGVPASQFPGSLMAFGTDYVPGYHTTNTPADSTLANTAAPSGIVIDGATFDGSLMGLTGEIESLTVSNVTSLRYSDLQDASGNSLGGAGNWFPPPHLFYLYEGDSTVGNRQGTISISTVNDQGIRVGNPQMRSSSSGNASSFKVDLGHTSVTNYVTHRPDGCADFITHVSNGPSSVSLTCFFDSSLKTVDGSKPIPGVRFPGPGNYANLTMSLTLTDTAAAPAGSILNGIDGGTNSNIAVTANLYQHNPPPGLAFPEFVGSNVRAAVTMHFSVCSPGTKFSVGANVTPTVVGC